MHVFPVCKDIDVTTLSRHHPDQQPTCPEVTVSLQGLFREPWEANASHSIDVPYCQIKPVAPRSQFFLTLANYRHINPTSGDPLSHKHHSSKPSSFPSFKVSQENINIFLFFCLSVLIFLSPFLLFFSLKNA